MTQMENGLFWEITWADIQRKMRLFIANKQNEFSQQHQILALVVASAFGGSAKGSPNQNKPPENQREVKTEEDVHALMAMLNR